MDARVAKYLVEAFRVGSVLAAGILYCERRIASLEYRQAAQEARTAELQSAVAGLAADDRNARAFGPSGLTDGAIRSAVDNTIRAETKHLATRDELERRAQDLERKLEDAIRAVGIRR